MMIPQKYIYGQKKALKSPNTFIGGIGDVINSAELLADKLDGVTASDIRAFSVDGNNNIACNIEIDYKVGDGAFSTNSLDTAKWSYGAIMTYFIADEKCIDVKHRSFFGQINMLNFNAKAVVTHGHRAFYDSSFNIAYFPKTLMLSGYGSAYCFRNNPNLTVIYLPNCTRYGSINVSSQWTDRAFNNIPNLEYIYVHPSMMTINAGGLEANLLAAQNSGATIIPVTSTVPPEDIADLSASSITNSTVDLNFTPPTSVNGIMQYDVFVDDGTGDLIKLHFKTSSILATGETLSGLSSGVTYIIKIQPTNNFYTKGNFSNKITITTL